MKKIFFFAAIAAAALSSCSSDELVQAPENNLEEGAINFEVYTGRTNRGVQVDNARLRAQGFGVFAYEQGTTPWATYVTSYNIPNFMYNQQVEAFTGSTITLKATISKAQYEALDATYQGYFEVDTNPNIYKKKASPSLVAPTNAKAYAALTEAQKAVIDIEVGTGEWTYSPVKYFSNVPEAKHSFFAYGPWKEDVNVKFSNNGPVVHYNIADDYDLLWGYNTETKSSTKSAFLNLAKQDVDKKLSFTFDHALTQINLGISYFADATHGTGDTGHTDDSGYSSEELANGTKIIVRSVKLVGDLATEGDLNLENGKWTYTNVSESSYEKSDIVFVGGTDKPDVLKPVFDNLMILPPMNGKQVKIKVIYDVETIDANNPTDLNNHTVTNTWESDPLTLAQGTAYDYQLHIGMTSVKFTAEELDDWGTTVEKEIDLPVTNMYPGLTAQTMLSLSTTAPTGDIAADAKYYDGSDHEAKKRNSGNTDWEKDTSVSGVIKTTSDKVDVVTSGTGVENDLTTLYFNPANGKYYSNVTFETEAPTLTPGNYYIIGATIFKAN